ncbi:hypothetical protein [Leptolyngbya sp. BC1307]|nr:hypothetical protein [Leptolyngbya sp. BC1307]
MQLRREWAHLAGGALPGEAPDQETDGKTQPFPDAEPRLYYVS